MVVAKDVTWIVIALAVSKLRPYIRPIIQNNPTKWRIGRAASPFAAVLLTRGNGAEQSPRPTN